MKCWVARDKSGQVYLYLVKPTKEESYWKGDDEYLFMPFPGWGFFPSGINPQWEDAEPVELELELKLPN